MLRRMFWMVGALALVLAAAGFAFAGSASAGDEPDGPPPYCAPDETCTAPAPCDPDVLCTEPGCSPDVICMDPIASPCPIDGPCDFGDSDGDGWQDFIESEWGSNPDDAASTPEHGYAPETCSDGVDNDGDGSTDMSDRGCRIDNDGDGWPDLTDNCPWDSNAIQADRDGDGIGDACDYDFDNDGWDDEFERQAGSDPNNANSTPEVTAIGFCDDGIDNDADGRTDAADAGCAPDQDYDFVADAADNCPTMWNQDQGDADRDGTGDACEDSDGDGFFDIDEVSLGSDPDNASSTPEYAWFEEACADGRDNDRDGLTDEADDGCQIIFLEEAPAADGSTYLPLSARDTYDGRMYKGVQPSALPAAGLGPAEGRNDSMVIALASGALAVMVGFGLLFGAVRASKKVTSR